MEYYKHYPYYSERKKGFTKKPEGVYVFYIQKLIKIGVGIITIVEKISDNKVNTVTYKINVNFKEIRNLNTYHYNNYRGILMRVEKKLSEGLFFYSNYHDNIFIGSDFISLDEKGKAKVSYSLNKKYELTEYNETFYNKYGEAVVEKHFFPKQWQIDIDDLQ